MSDNKGVMMCGKDGSNYARAVSVDENGVLQMPYSSVTDDNNKKVLRVVDAAPYLVEYGVISELTTHHYAFIVTHFTLPPPQQSNCTLKQTSCHSHCSLQEALVYDHRC